jgi:hypothetical protein
MKQELMKRALSLLNDSLTLLPHRGRYKTTAHWIRGSNAPEQQ